MLGPKSNGVCDEGHVISKTFFCYRYFPDICKKTSLAFSLNSNINPPYCTTSVYMPRLCTVHRLLIFVKKTLSKKVKCKLKLFLFIRVALKKCLIFMVKNVRQQ
jgi:hypothetical protein